MFATALLPYAESDIDLNRVIQMLLVHDVGEIDAGDRIAFAEGGWEELKAAELASVERIFGILPGAQGATYLELWLEFERSETPEARFANSVDRAMPVLLNLANNGQSWRENGISYERVVKRIEAQINDGCPSLWRYLAVCLERERQLGWFGIESH